MIFKNNYLEGQGQNFTQDQVKDTTPTEYSNVYIKKENTWQCQENKLQNNNQGDPYYQEYIREGY